MPSSPRNFDTASVTSMNNEEQIASVLGEIMGKLDALREEFRRYTAEHQERHGRIDDRIEEHAAAINQAKGAKGAIIAAAAVIAGIFGALGHKIGKLFQ